MNKCFSRLRRPFLLNFLPHHVNQLHGNFNYGFDSTFEVSSPTL